VKSGRLFSIMPGYEALDVERRLPGARLFISDYQGGHPFVDDYLGSLASCPVADLGDVTRYAALMRTGGYGRRSRSSTIGTMV
jgi:hypothetical protein